MQKFQVLCDPNAKSNGSSRIIVDSINNAAKKLDLFDENDITCLYDCLCQDFGLKADVLMSAYELPMPRYLLDSARGRPILGLSKDNAFMAVYGGYPAHLVNYVNLGVDSNRWPYSYKKTSIGKFVFLCCCESNSRSGFENLIPAFSKEFNNNKNVQLYIKDRSATDLFKSWVREQADFYKVEIIHDDRDLHTVEEQLELYARGDVFVCVNHSHTWGLTRTQALSCGLPLLTMRYQGGAEYLQHPLSGLEIEYNLEHVDNEVINKLMNIGLKNHLFPMDDGVYTNKPFWAVAKETSLREQMRKIYSSENLRQTLSIASRRMAEWLSWERTAVNMSLVLLEFKNKGYIN